jgi:hypothetical protein
MVCRSAILILALLVNCSALGGHLMGFAKGEPQQETREGQTPKVKCTISTTDVKWRLGGEHPAVSIHIQFQGAAEVSVMPSIHLSALPKRHGLDQVEYWAPFNVNTGVTSRESQKVRAGSKSNARSVRVIPTQLLWAPTKSSVWPCQGFAKTVPPGRYSLRVELELVTGSTVRSNEIAITVVK